MPLRKHGFPLLIVILVLGMLAPVSAQGAPVRVDGSPALFPFAQTSGLDFAAATGNDVIVNISGEDAAFAALCADDLDIVTAARPITDDEIAACQGRGVRWVELLIALDGAAVFSNLSSDAAACFTTDDLAELYSGAEGTVLGRGREYQQFFAAALGLDALRDDFTAVNDDAAALDGLNQAAGVVTYTSLAGGLAAPFDPAAIDGGAGCVPPSAETVRDGSYPLGRMLYMYVNVGSGERPEVAAFVDYTLGEENMARLPELGLVLPDATDRTLNAANWSLRTTGRTFSAPPEAELVATGPDAVLYDGPSVLSPAAAAAVETAAPNASAVEYLLDAGGTDAALSRFCNAELDVAGASRPIGDAELAACRDSGVAFIELQVGLNPLLVVTNPANDYAQCLTVNQTRLLFGAENEGLILRWEQVREGLPPYDLTLFVPQSPAVGAFTALFGALRADVEVGDAAAGVAEAEAGVGLLTYADALAAGSAVNVVAIDGGAGCVEPSAANVQSGAYALTQPLYVYVNAESVARPGVRLLARALTTADGAAAGGFVAPGEADLLLGQEALRTGTLGPVFSR